MRTLLGFPFLALVSLSIAGCGRPATPFDQMKGSNVTLFRLQNFEPPASSAATTLPFLPPEIQRWVGAGASMLPPGLIPPGLLGGAQSTAASQTGASPDGSPRFNGFRILGQQVVSDASDKAELADILGFSSNFDNGSNTCMYAEFGVREERLGAAPADLLISLSCDRVQAVNFAWPHAKSSLTPKTVSRLTSVFRRVFGA